MDDGDKEVKMKLDEFLDNFNRFRAKKKKNNFFSEDNHSFGQILEKQKENWKQKFWWMFKNNESETLALPSSEKTQTKMVLIFKIFALFILLAGK